jgi:hypothetical protein
VDAIRGPGTGFALFYLLVSVFVVYMVVACIVHVL